MDATMTRIINIVSRGWNFFIQPASHGNVYTVKKGDVKLSLTTGKNKTNVEAAEGVISFAEGYEKQ